ncbi:hypothetical protein T12_4594 [Trichinella patagoniensis]|uniref:Uncharacterized protein n=1 Tax=Trichinella patagoniensis TaxID=990121 RepID=A0A0V0ZBZ9_9BILA|nr:hypothetical protein T12_4594 [Trichinella patagoniensis]
MNGKQLLIPLWYNLESTIHAPGSHGCQQSNVGTRRNYQYMFRFTSYKLEVQFIQIGIPENWKCCYNIPDFSNILFSILTLHPEVNIQS